jgi:hypothetical protein
MFDAVEVLVPYDLTCHANEISLWLHNVVCNYIKKIAPIGFIDDNLDSAMVLQLSVSSDRGYHNIPYFLHLFSTSHLSRSPSSCEIFRHHLICE